MDLIQKKKPGRPPGRKNNLPLTDKAAAVFNEMFKTFNDDLTKASPAERLNYTIQLAGYLLTTKQTN